LNESGCYCHMDAKTKMIFTTTLLLFLVTGVLGGVILERKVLAPMYARQETPVAGTGQPHQPPPRHGDGIDPLKSMVDRMTKELSLNEQQQEEFRDILEKHREKFETLRTEIKEKFDSLDLELSEETMKILTEEQKKKFEDRFVRWPKPAEQQPGPPGQGPPPEAFDACKGKTGGSDCSFTDNNGEHRGRCGHGARDEFICMPADAPPAPHRPM